MRGPKRSVAKWPTHGLGTFGVVIPDFLGTYTVYMFFLLMCVAALRGFLKMLLERLAFSVLGMGTSNH